jgi:predicted RecA/RadA family phage recombinase
MKNYIQDGKTITLTAPAGGVVSGVGVLIGALFVVPLFSAGVSESFEARTTGVVQLPKASGAVTEGAKLYWDNTAKNVTTTATANTFIGYAAGAQASGDATVNVLLRQAGV